MFAREWSVRLLCCAEHICVDGTFRSAPVTHSQVLTFHVLCKKARRSLSCMRSSRTSDFLRTPKFLTHFSDIQMNDGLELFCTEEHEGHDQL